MCVCECIVTVICVILLLRHLIVDMALIILRFIAQSSYFNEKFQVTRVIYDHSMNGVQLLDVCYSTIIR